MTAFAGAGSSPEYAVHVAVLARQIPVEATKLVAGRQVIELGTLYGGRMRHSEKQRAKGAQQLDCAYPDRMR